MPERSRRHFFASAGAAAFAGAGCLASGSLFAAGEKTSANKHAEKSKIPFQLGLASYTTRKFSFDDTLKTAARLGLKQVCLKDFHLPLDASPQAIKAALDKADAAGVNLYAIGVVYMSDPKVVEQAFACAKAAGMGMIVGVPLPDVLPLVERKVKETGISVAIHNHGPGDKVYPTLEMIHDKIQKLDPRIGYCMDVGHTTRWGLNAAAELRRFADRMLDMHIKDVSASDAAGQCVEMGRGVIDLPALFAAMVEVNFKGNASFEYEKDENDPLPGLAESVGYARGISAML